MANGFFQISGNWNGDGGVSIFDFTTFAYWFAQSIPATPQYVDLNGDGGISIFDFPLFAENFGKSIVFPIELGIAPETPIPAVLDRLAVDGKLGRRIESGRRLDEVAVNDTALLQVLAQWQNRVRSRNSNDTQALMKIWF